MMCEACWSTAYMRSVCDTSKSQSDHYRESVTGEYHTLCTPRAQAGQWWDNERQIDTRKDKDGSTH